MSLFNQLCGFDQTALSQLNERDNRYLEISSLLSLLGVVFCSLSAFYLFYACTDSFFSALIAAVIVFLILYNLLVVLISGASYPIFKKVSDEVRQAPRWTRLVIFLLISLAFTQPMMVFLLDHSPLSKKIDSKLDQRNELNTQVIRKSLESFENKKLREIALMSEQYNRLITEKYGDEQDIDQVLPITNQSGRKALLIGNQTYAERPLDNPKKDVTDLAAVLRQMGFEVTVQTDLDRVKMERTIDAYVNTLGPKDISLFYFSGHGFMDEGNNYLMPIGMRSDSRSEAVGLNINIEKIAHKSPLLSVIIIDACRDFPFGSNRRGGLADVNIGPNTYLALAARAGQRAADGEPNTNGVFTGAIIKNIPRQVSIEKVFRSVREEVYRKTNGAQLPLTTDTLREEFILAAPRHIKTTTDPEPPLPNSASLKTDSLYRGLTINPDEEEKNPAFQYCGITGSADDDPKVRDQLIECLGHKLLKAQDDLDKLRDDVRNFEAEGLAYQDSTFKEATRFMKAYMLLWSEPIFIAGTLALTLLLLAAMSSGHIMREGIPAAFLRYEYRKQQLERARVEKAYAANKKKWRGALHDLKKRIDEHIPENQFNPDIEFAATAEQDYLNSRVQTGNTTPLPDESSLLSALNSTPEKKS
jgi:hypothetical protein